MADFSELAPLEGLHSRAPGSRRRLSYASQGSSQSVTGRRHVLQGQTSAASVRSLPESETDQSEIYSPVPRRHFLLHSESDLWLKAPTFSPGSSRPTSPLSASNSLSNLQSSARASHHSRTVSFGSLHEHDRLPRRKEEEVAKDSKLVGDIDEGLGRVWIKWMYRNRMREYVAVCAVLATILVKCCVGMSGYSGAGIPPLFGDLEAQRHWMELTIHLPIQEWYTYDRAYWGLDYPPLTAYHSWICGIIGSAVEPTWFALDISRGTETYGSKLFMRSTVIVSDLLVYFPALIFFSRAWLQNRSTRAQNAALLFLLLQPSLILIDSGHFQYNSVMLGFTLLSLNFFATGNDLIGAVCFVASLGFKQMALYYAPAIGSYLLGKCLYRGWRAGALLFARLALVTAVSFIIIFIPFLPPFAPVSAIFSPFQRIFPFARGLFEDKVANFWCATDVAFKWRRWFSQEVLLRLSTLITALGFLPAVANLLIGGIKAADTSTVNGDASSKQTGQGTRLVNMTATPTLPILPWALLTSSLSFFLFSFQVHEKTILLPLLPLNLLLSGAPRDSVTFNWGMLTNNVALFSLWPLLKKDGLALPYIVLAVLWNHTVGFNPFVNQSRSPVMWSIITGISLIMIFLHVLELLISPPARYPDVYVVLNVLVSTAVFGLTWLWSIKRGVEVTWSLCAISVGPPSRSRKD